MEHRSSLSIAMETMFLINEDIRSIIPKPPGKIFAIFKKSLTSPLYTQLTYKSPNTHFIKKCLPKELLKEIEPSLLEDNHMNQ